MTTLRAMIAAVLMIASFGVAVAKLPPPPPPDEAAKAAAAQKKAKDAAAAQEEKAALARAEDRAVAHYIAEQKAKGIIVHPTPIAAPASASVMSAQGNTPTGSTTGQSAEGKGTGKGSPASGQAATGPGAAKDTNQK